MKLRVLKYGSSSPDLVDDEYAHSDLTKLKWFHVNIEGQIIEGDKNYRLCMLAKDELHAFQMWDAYKKSQEYEP